MILSGNPLSGRELDQLKIFLKKMNLEYDEGIEYSICILNEKHEITGTGSADRNVLKCIAVDPAYQGRGISAQILSELIQYEFEKGRPHIFIYTKPGNQDMFSDMGFYTILMTKQILFMENRKSGFDKFIEDIRRETPGEALEKDRKIGAVVANCNPFTLGHKYLLQKALEECDYLHLFLLSDDRGMFTPKERFEMVREGISGMDRILVHWTGDYMVSAATFPTYFFKDKAQGRRANCRLDLELFAKRIAPELHITERFVGTEPGCAVTGMYNQEMKGILPRYGINVKEIERITSGGIPISASAVRQAVIRDNLEAVKSMLPPGGYQYLSRYLKKHQE